MNRVGIFLIVLVLYSCGTREKSVRYGTEDSNVLHGLQKQLTDIIVHDIFSPPVASRVYVYPMLAMYEAARFSNPESKSLIVSLNGFEGVPLPEKDKEYDFTIAAITAFSETAQRVIFSKEEMTAYENQQVSNLMARNSDEINTRSITFGKSVAEVIIKRLSSDNYKETRGMERFEVKIAPGLWVPTPPDYADGVEPHWAKMKSMSLDSSNQCRMELTIAYNESKDSEFWKELTEVFDLVNNLKEDSDELNMAVFWDDNPFVSRHKGHLMFQDKKMTPGGHWLSIAREISKKKKEDFYSTAKMYALTSVAIFDAFISCWDTKYYTVRVRPETVIHDKLNKEWHPHLITPPFPAFTSGHSTVSSAAAEMLTYIYGDAYTYTDSTEVEYGLPVRSFTSFRQAASEASMSRVYAGIHYRSDCEKGNEQGKKVTTQVLSRLRTKSFLEN